MEDKRDVLKEEIFDYKQLKNGNVFLYWNNQHVKTLSGKEAERFLKRIAGANDFETQLAMAKITGNFKRGNEKTNKGK